MYPITPKNIRLRYLAAKDEAKRSDKGDGSVGDFTYEDMAGIFMVSSQACYTWTLPKGSKYHRSPKGKRAARILGWINDGAIDAYIRRVRAAHPTGSNL